MNLEISDDTLRLWCIRRTIATLPAGNLVIMDRVCSMFKTIAEFSEKNKMTAKNIALVMNPTMFRDKGGSMLEFVSSGGIRTRLVKLLILHHEEMFVVSFQSYSVIVEGY